MQRPTVTEIETLMQRGDIDIEIKPDGTVVAVNKEPRPPVPLMFRQDLPSNY